jgi:hypothetical protein
MSILIFYKTIHIPPFEKVVGFYRKLNQQYVLHTCARHYSNPYRRFKLVCVDFDGDKLYIKL